MGLMLTKVIECLKERVAGFHLTIKSLQSLRLAELLHVNNPL